MRPHQIGQERFDSRSQLRSRFHSLVLSLA
jgi:hypothetical protein